MKGNCNFIKATAGALVKNFTMFFEAFNADKS